MTPGAHKICPSCGTMATLNATMCAHCGHAYRTHFPSPPAGPTPGPTQAFVPPAPSYPSSGTSNPYASPYSNPYGPQQGVQYGAGPQNDYQLAEFARQYQAAHQTFVWTLVAGLLCLWPLLIVTVLEANKKSTIRNKVASMGVDVRHWQAMYGLK